jgi:hypothetical protein
MWTPVEPGSRVVAGLQRAGLILLALAVIATFGGWLFTIVRDSVRWENLRSRGQTAWGTVVDSETDSNGDSGSLLYVFANVEECSCTLKVRVTTLDGHPDFSVIPLRYDPQDLSNAVPLVDRPTDDLLASMVGFAITIAVIAPIWIKVWRRRKRSRRLLTAQVTTRAVTFQAWRRNFGDSSQHYLVLFDAGSSPSKEPLCCVPVTRRSIRRLGCDGILQLYGDGIVGDVALRCEGTVVVPSGDVKAGTWEERERRD